MFDGYKTLKLTYPHRSYLSWIRSSHHWRENQKFNSLSVSPLLGYSPYDCQSQEGENSNNYVNDDSAVLKISKGQWVLHVTETSVTLRMLLLISGLGNCSIAGGEQFSRKGRNVEYPWWCRCVATVGLSIASYNEFNY